MDWEQLYQSPPPPLHLGKLRPGRTEDMPDLVHQAGRARAGIGAPFLFLLPFPSSSLLLPPPPSSLALSLLVTQDSESSSGTTEETS